MPNYEYSNALSCLRLILPKREPGVQTPAFDLVLEPSVQIMFKSLWIELL